MILRSLSAVALAAIAALGGVGGCGNGDAGDAPAVEPRISRSAIEQSLAAAEEYLQADDLARAEAILLTLIDRAPREAAAHELHGQVLLARAADARGRGNVAASQELGKRAYERYRTLLELSPPSAGLHHSAGDIANMAGLDEEALAHYQKAIQLDPLQARHAIFAAQLLAQAERYEEAEAALRGAVAIDPDEPLAHASLANVAMQRGRLEEAIEHVREARAIRPDNVSFRVIEARIHRLAGRPREGVGLLVGLSREQQSQRSVAQELAAGQAELGDQAAAAATWARAFQALSHERDAWTLALSAAEQFLEAGRREEAMHWANQARLAATAAGVEEVERITAFEQRLAAASEPRP